MIVVQSPLRVSLFGGGTDFPSYFRREGGCVLTSAIDKYVFVTVKGRFDRKLRIGYTQTEIVDSIDAIQHELIREALRMTGVTEGVEITTMGDIPSAGSGLGSSSTVTVGALRALYEQVGVAVTPERLAREACAIEIQTLGRPIGVQDQYIAAYGGLRFMEFTSDDRILVREIPLASHLKRELEENLLLFFTGITRRAEDVLTEQQLNIEQRLAVLGEMKAMAHTARDELTRGNLDAIGCLLHESWQLKKQLASQISNGHIDEIYTAARRAGALGGKITGAGGGGFLLLYCPRERQGEIRYALRDLQELPFRFEPDGAKVIFNYRQDLQARRVPAEEVSEADEMIQRLWCGSENSGASAENRASRPIHGHIDEYIDELRGTLGRVSQSRIAEAITILQTARLDHRQVFLMGNGGSASTASHFACDLGKSVQVEGWPDFRVIALTDNMATFSAYGNDEGYESVFARQLANLLQPEDVVIGISASGNSSNVIRAIELARERGARTIAMTGFDGGRLGTLVDLNLHVPSDRIEHVEDVHLALEHMICTSLREAARASGIGDDRVELTAMDLPIPRRAPKGEIARDKSLPRPDSDGRASKSVELLYRISRQVASNHSLQGVLHGILSQAMQGLRARSGSILMIDDMQRPIAGAIAYAGVVTQQVTKDLAETLEHGLAGWVVRHQQAVVLPITSHDARWLRRSWDNHVGQPRSAVSVPLAVGSHVFGVLTLLRQGPDPFSDADLSLLGAIATCISLIGIDSATVEG